jgi:hypothetical protein
MSDDKKGLLTKIIGNINLARHRSYLLTQLIYHGAHKIMHENCNMLRNMRESLEKEKALNQKTAG